VAVRNATGWRRQQPKPPIQLASPLSSLTPAAQLAGRLAGNGGKLPAARLTPPLDRRTIDSDHLGRSW
jgi:hypothetical protein